MKKILKLILIIICWIIGLILLCETLSSFKRLDPWGLGFVFYTLPAAIISILFLVGAIILTKDIIKNKGDVNGINEKNKIHKIVCIFIVGIIIIGISGLVIYNKYLKTESEIVYTLTYYDDLIPGSKSDIEVYSNKIEITTTHFCSAVDCNASTEKKTFNYSNENIEKLEKFINNNFSTNNIELNESELNEYQKEVVQGLLLGEYFFEVNVENYKYKLEYSKTDNLSYVIYFKNDKHVLVKKLSINNDYDIVKIETYSLEFSDESINILNNYIENEVKNENSNVIYKYSTLKKDEINIINSIIENDESYLENINNEAKLTYTISYDGINCPTPSLYLYSDNTYEYYYTFSTDDEKLIPKIGIYNYDITKIINNINKYEENQIGFYYIKDNNGNKYVVGDTNEELQELLTSLDVTLEMCLEQQ